MENSISNTPLTKEMQTSTGTNFKMTVKEELKCRQNCDLSEYIYTHKSKLIQECFTKKETGEMEIRIILAPKMIWEWWWCVDGFNESFPSNCLQVCKL